MSIKILTNQGEEITHIDDARAYNFDAGNRSGILKGAFNEGRFFAVSSNVIGLDSCELRIAGHRIIIDSAESITLSNIPTTNTRYSMIAEIVVSDTSVPTFRLFIQPSTTPLTQNNLYKTSTGNGTYQLEIGRFTLTTNGLIEDVVRTADVITGGGNGSLTDIEFNANAYDLESDKQPEVSVDFNEETKKYDMLIGIPKGQNGLDGSGINPNLLINGDFRVNQRGQTSYTTINRYTVDRWKLTSGSVTVTTNGIVLNGTIIQKLEYTPTQIVTASASAGNINYSNGVVTLSTNTETLINWAKLEIGSVATAFSPRPYAEEMAMCQRFYQIYYGYKKAVNGWQYYEPNVVLNTPMRTQPTKEMYAVNSYNEISNNEKTVYDITDGTELTITTATYGYGNNYAFTLANGHGTFTKDHEYRFVIYCDSEIY